MSMSILPGWIRRQLDVCCLRPSRTVYIQVLSNIPYDIYSIYAASRITYEATDTEESLLCVFTILESI